MTMVAVQCTHCGTSYSVSENRLGQTGKCQRCGNRFAIQSTAVTIDAPNATDTHGPPPGTARRKLGERIGRFTIWKHLGTGAFGDVYQAQDTLLKRDVALKLPHQSVFASENQRARFLREPQAAAGLRHPNIVPIYDAGVEGDQFYIASAFIDGQVLQHRLAERRPDFREAVLMMVALAEALDYAHGEGIVHRDLKPANIMLDAKDQPLVLDFGLARLREAEDQLTHDGMVLGTPAYMAPEQATGNHDEVGPTSDQYSLGVVLYELLCGARPFEGPAAAVMSLVIHQEPQSPRARNAEIPRDLETICQKAMSKRPPDRYASCSELADDLRRWLNNEPIRARRMGPVERTAKWARRNPALAGMALIVGALATVSSITAFELYRSMRKVDDALGQVGFERQSVVEMVDKLQVETKTRQLLESNKQSYERQIREANEKRSELEGVLDSANSDINSARQSISTQKTEIDRLGAELARRVPPENVRSENPGSPPPPPVSPADQPAYIAGVRNLLEAGLQPGVGSLNSARGHYNDTLSRGEDPRLHYAWAIVCLKQRRKDDEILPPIRAATVESKFFYPPAWQALVRLQVAAEQYTDALESQVNLSEAIQNSATEWPDEHAKQQCAQWNGRMVAFVQTVAGPSPALKQAIEKADADILQRLGGPRREAYEDGKLSELEALNRDGTIGNVAKEWVDIQAGLEKLNTEGSKAKKDLDDELIELDKQSARLQDEHRNLTILRDRQEAQHTKALQDQTNDDLRLGILQRIPAGNSQNIAMLTQKLRAYPALINQLKTQLDATITDVNRVEATGNNIPAAKAKLAKKYEDDENDRQVRIANLGKREKPKLANLSKVRQRVFDARFPLHFEMEKYRVLESFPAVASQDLTRRQAP